MVDDEKVVVGRNEWDVTMELLKIAQFYNGIEDETTLVEKFKEYYQMVMGVQSETQDIIRNGKLKKFYSSQN